MVAYQDNLNLEHMDQLLKYLKKSYLENIKPNIIIEKGIIKKWPEFDNDFIQAVKDWKNYVDKLNQK